MGQRHHEQVQNASTAAFKSVQASTKPLLFARSDSARIEQIMRSNLIEFAARVDDYNTPVAVLDALDDAIAEDVSLMVLGAKRFSVNVRDRDNLRVGENVFIHKSVPDGW